MKVPLLDLHFQNQVHKKELMAAVEGVLDKNGFILGPAVQEFEKNVAAYSRVQHAVGVSSGTDALLVALMAAGVGPGDEVVTTPYTFFSTAGSVVRLGAKPVFVDIDPDSYNLDPTLVEKAITPKTKALLPVHLYGQCADMNALLLIAQKHNLLCIEDAAQAIGAETAQGHRAGETGDMGCFSFFPSKNLGALGDGGMVVTNNKERAEKIRVLRVHGAQPKYFHKWVGGNFRLDALQAAVLDVKLKYLDGWTQDRQKNALRYHTLFEQSGLVGQGAVQVPKILTDFNQVSHSHIFNQYVVRVKNRDGLRDHLKAHEIGCEIYYPVPLHQQACFKDLGYQQGDFPQAEAAARDTLAIPVYPGLRTEQQDFVVQTIQDFYKGAS